MIDFDKTISKMMFHICAMPGGWVGKADFNWVVAYINGTINGMHAMSEGKSPTVKDWDFQKFVTKRYGIGNNIVWAWAYTASRSWGALTEEEKLKRLLKDFKDYDNVLTRIVAELE